VEAAYQNTAGVTSPIAGYNTSIQVNTNQSSVISDIVAVNADTFAQTASWSPSYADQSLSSLMALLVSHRADASTHDVVYALVDDTGQHDLAQLRSIQDWNLRYALSSVKGVAEVAPVGGFVKQYQVDLDPNALVAYHIPLIDVIDAIKKSNGDVGGGVFEVATTEYFIRGRGYIKSVADLENIVLKVDNGTPVYLKNVANVHLGGEPRRGACSRRAYRA